MPDSFHMPPDEFRRCGKQLIDWIADYYETIEKYPVQSACKPGEIRAGLPAHAPVTGESFDAIFKDFEALIVPGITHWQSPHFYGFFPANTSGPSILGELLSAGLGVQGMLWMTSPACTELEMQVLDWLADMLDLPAQFKFSGTGGGVIQDSASSATLCALLAARERAIAQHGEAAHLIAYTSTQAHSSVEKAVGIAGLGGKNLRCIEVDRNYAMQPAALVQQIKHDREAGLHPAFVCATLGTTGSTAFDPLPAIGEICTSQNLWLHVDAAMAGTAALCPEFRYLQQGLEFADSYCFNPHKWMFTNFDCDCFYVRDRAALTRALSIVPEYLRNAASDSGAVVDYRDWQIPLGRRFRSLKLWFVIRYYGVEGLQFHVRQHVAWAQEFAQWIDDDPDLELAAPVPLNLVCFRHCAGDVFNKNLHQALNDSGKLFLSHTLLDGRYTLRLCVGQSLLTREHLARDFAYIQETAREILSK